MLNKKMILMFLLGGMLSMTGCGSGKATPKDGPSAEKEKETPGPQMTLRVYKYQTDTTEEEFIRTFVEPVKKKYPNYDFEFILNDKGKSPSDLVAAGEFPDIVITGMRGIIALNELDIPLPLEDLIKKYNVNMSQYEPQALNAVKSFSPTGNLTALPYLINTRALFYNKDTFDKFAVSYPKDNMTWDEVKDLTKRLTRIDGSTQYRGIALEGIAELARGLSLPYVELKSEKAVVNTDTWKRVFETTKDLYSASIPEITGWSQGMDLFLKDKTTAMLPWYEGTIRERISQLEKAGIPFSWDMVSYPSFTGSSGNTELDANTYLLSKTSKHQEDAFKVISYLAANTELQTENAKRGILPAIKINGIEKVYGQDLPVLKGKNVAGLFKTPFRENPTATKYDNIGRSSIGGVFKEYLNGSIDVVTALRKAEDDINNKIQTTKSQQPK